MAQTRSQTTYRSWQLIGGSELSLREEAIKLREEAIKLREQEHARGGR